MITLVYSKSIMCQAQGWTVNRLNLISSLRQSCGLSIILRMLEMRLRELKQSIIAEAVTKGLSPKVPMKDSGTAWQGKVPAHWEKFRNKNELIPNSFE